MKKLLSLLIAIMLIISAVPLGVFTLTASAESYTEGYYTYTVENGEATITDFVETVGIDIIMPSSLGRYPVTNIGDWAFANCDIRSITISDSVTSIGDSAFRNCQSLTSITIGNGVANIHRESFINCNRLKAINVNENNCNYCSVDGVLFNKNKTILIRYPENKTDASYIIPNNVTNIGEYAFYSCSRLTDVTIPNSVVGVNYCAFYGCYNLTSITIPNRVTSIGGSAFKSCSSLISIIIPDSIIRIDHEAFHSCRNLTNITIPDSVKSIGRNAFYDTSYYNNSSNWRNDVLYINNHLINCKKNVSGEYTIKSGTKTIADDAFYNNDNLTSIIIPNSVINIGDHAFYGCDRLTSVTIPDSVTSIDDYAFNFCERLKSVTISDSVKSIGEYAFNNCTKLEKVYITDIAAWCNIEFYGFGSNPLYYADNLYLNGELATDVIIPQGVIQIPTYAFSCNSLTSITIPDSIVSIGYYAFDSCSKLETVFYEGSEEEWNKIGKSAGNAYLINANIIFNYDGYSNDITNIRNNYYANVGDIGFVIRDKNGMGLSSCTVIIDGKEYVSDLNTLYVNIPDGYTGDVTVSKDGYITSTLPVEQLEKFTFFVMYPDTEEAPVVQHMMLRESHNPNGEYSDLLISDEYIYDLGNKRHDLYLQIAPNGHTISSIYLKQGNTKIELENGLNKDINTNGLFNSKNGTIYLCIETADGKIYKIDSNIVALEKMLRLDASIDGEISGVVDEEMEAIGGWEFNGKLNLGGLPVSVEIGEDYSVKGTIGVKGNDANVATWYEAISSTIKAHDKNGDEEYDSETVEELVKGLEESGADIEEGYSSFGIDVKGSIIGYIEGKWNPELARLEDVKVGAIFKIAGEMSYVQQSAIMVAAVPIPYYWTVEFGLELAAKIGAGIEIDQENHIDFEIAFPEISFDIEIGGSLCLGVDKVIGGGGKVKGNVKLIFVEPNYDFTSCTVEATLEFGLTGQLAGFSGDFIMWNGTHELYSSKDKYNSTINNVNLMSEYVRNSVLLASAHNFDSATYLTHQSKNSSSYTFKTNGYTYASPTIAQLSDGTAVMVWVDYDNDRSDINKTALYYSVYNLETNIWSTPTQVEDDGTADDLPVLKTINNKIYLVWNDADSVLLETDDLNDMLACMGISYAEFDGSVFTSVSSASGKNNYMDICADITVVDGKPNVVWLANENNDLFGQSGINKLMIAKHVGSNWLSSCSLETTDIINSFTVVEENKNAAIYYSASDRDEYNSDNYEIFKLSSGSCEQITNNQYADTSVTSYDNVVYWKSVDAVYSCDESIECMGIAERYIIVEDMDGYRSVIFTTNGNSNDTTYMVCTETENGFGEPMVLTSGDYISGGFSAYFDSEKMNFVSNEINVDNMGTAINLYSFKKDSKLTVENVYYDKYTLMKGSELRTTLSVKNVGFDMAAGYTIYAYSDDNLLASQYVSASLLSGDTIEIKMLINIPIDIDVETISYYVVLDAEEINLNDIDYLLSLALVDISIENSMIVADQNTTNLYASIVNRGIKDISEAVITLHEDSEEGEIINFVTVKNLVSRTETIVSFDISDYVKNGMIYYVTVDTLTGEEFIGNNSDFTIANSIKQNEIVVDDFKNGDINGDTSINNKDLGLLMQYLNDWEVTIVEEASDVNADGKINNKDYGLLMQYLNDWDVELQ